MHASITGKRLGIVLLAACSCFVAVTDNAAAQQYNPHAAAAYQQQHAIAIRQQQLALASRQQALMLQRQRQELEAKFVILHTISQRAQNGQNPWHSQAEQQLFGHLLGQHAGNPNVIAHFRSQLPALVQYRGQGAGQTDHLWMANVQARMPYLFNNQFMRGVPVTSSQDPQGNAGIKQMLGLRPSDDIVAAAQNPGFLMSLSQGSQVQSANVGSSVQHQATARQQYQMPTNPYSTMPRQVGSGAQWQVP